MNFYRMGAIALGVALSAPAEAQDKQMILHKDPNCGCCTAWGDLAEAAGYHVEIDDNPDLSRVKAALGVPGSMTSCHTAEIDGRLIEGHVPLDLVDELLTERPDVAGLAVPGMPAGSPGMGNDPAASYDVLSFGGEAGDGAVYRRMDARP